MAESEKTKNRENPYSELLNGKNDRADLRLIQGVLGGKPSKAKPGALAAHQAKAARSKQPGGIVVCKQCTIPGATRLNAAKPTPTKKMRSI